jgi:NADH dehydrogenase
MPSSELNVVTGAFGYTGKYITRRLLAMGQQVKTLTGHPDRPSPFGDQVEAAPFNFDNPAALAESLRGATTLFNTYWVRFNYGKSNYAMAVRNIKTLFTAAKEAGVQRVVHVSIANPSLDSRLPYYSGKAEVEQALTGSGLSYGILRPTVIFGDEDILINNIAWIVRRFPIFGVPGDGQYGLQAMYVEDMADLAVDVAGRNDNVILDAVGPESYRFDDLIRLIAAKLGRRIALMHVPPALALFAAQIIGKFVGDVVLTREEVDGLVMNLLVSKNPATGQTRLSEWLERHAHTVGRKYASEVKKHFR